MSIFILALDPGKDKCGLAVVEISGQVIAREIVATAQISTVLPLWLQRHEITRIIIGNSTTSKAMRQTLKTLAPALDVIAVEEKNSTLEARALYWREKPPRGWRRVLPLSLQEPPEPVDDFAAVILAQRFFKSLESAGEAQE